MKYKVGDEVRVRKDIIDDHFYDSCLFLREMNKYKGKTFIISERGTICNRYRLDGLVYWFTSEMLEPISTEMPEIKQRYLIRLKNGIEGMFVNKSDLLVIKDGKFDYLTPFKQKDIQEIYKPHYSKIWERSEVKEMTLEEISKELGYEIKIKEEK